MKKFAGKYGVIIMLLAAFLTTACATYYKVADPVTGNVYYTEKVKREGSAAMFKDARSGAEVTIQNSEVSEVSEKDFQAGLKTPVSKPVKAPASVPASAPADAKTDKSPPTAPEPSSAPEGEAK